VLVATLKQRFEFMGKLIDGTPLVVYENGKCHEDRMNIVRVQQQDIKAAARQQGVTDMDEVAFAVVERNGDVSVGTKH
jgi:uncharacterized membrane protein YcaP (DUF421 family)